MSDNWVVQNLENALETWNEKLSEIWTLITTTPQNFKGGNIWKVIVDINGAVQAIGLALLVLFFVIGMVKTCGSFTDVKKPEHALKLFVRFALAKGVITYGMELMLALFNIVQGTISTIMNAAGFGTPEQTTLPAEMVTTIEDCGFFESIPLWAVTLIGGLFITVLSFILIMTVYGRFFKLYMYTALAPIPLSTFAGEPTQNVGKSQESISSLRRVVRFERKTDLHDTKSKQNHTDGTDKSEDKVRQIVDYGKRVIRCKCSRCHSKCQRTDNDHCAISTEAFPNLSGHRQFLCFLSVSCFFLKNSHS